MSQPKDIGFIPGGITAFQPSLDGEPAGFLYPYQLANLSQGGGILGGNGTVSQIANNTITSLQLANGIIGPNQIANFSITGSQLANNTVESAQIGLDVIQHISANITAAQINALGAGVTVANAVAGLAYRVYGWSAGLSIQANNIAPTGGANLVLQCNGANTSANINSAVITGNAATKGIFVIGGTQTLDANTPLILTTANSANFAAANNVTGLIDIWASLV